jgi:hypothetical protein
VSDFCVFSVSVVFTPSFGDSATLSATTGLSSGFFSSEDSSVFLSLCSVCFSSHFSSLLLSFCSVVSSFLSSSSLLFSYKLKIYMYYWHFMSIKRNKKYFLKMDPDVPSPLPATVNKYFF